MARGNVRLHANAHLTCQRFDMLTGSGVRVIHFKELGQGLSALFGSRISMGFDACRC